MNALFLLPQFSAKKILIQLSIAPHRFSFYYFFSSYLYLIYYLFQDFFPLLDLFKLFHHSLLKWAPRSQSSSFSKQPSPGACLLPCALPLCSQQTQTSWKTTVSSLSDLDIAIYLNQPFPICPKFTFKFYFPNYLVLTL